MDRTEQARRAANVSWANTKDRTARTAPARQARDAKFATPEERQAFFKELAAKGVAARGQKIHPIKEALWAEILGWWERRGVVPTGGVLAQRLDVDRGVVYRQLRNLIAEGKLTRLDSGQVVVNSLPGD